MLDVVLILVGIIVLLLGLVYNLSKSHEKEIAQKDEEFKKLQFQKKSSEVRLGQITEHVAPFLKDFPFDPKKARFIGTPIDMIIFEDDKIVIVEVKSGGSRLSDTQRKIKQLVADRQIEWYEHRVE